MKKMIVQRLLHLVVVLFLVTLVSFFLMYFSPGDPVTALLSRGGTVPDPDVVAQKRAELGLDRPVAEQYVAWLAGVLQGNLGTSISSGRPVAAEIAARMPATLFLAVVSLVLTLAVSIPLGCLCALKKNRATDLAHSLRFLRGGFGSRLFDGPDLDIRVLPNASLAAQHRKHEGCGLGSACVDVGPLRIGGVHPPNPHHRAAGNGAGLR